MKIDLLYLGSRQLFHVSFDIAIYFRISKIISQSFVDEISDRAKVFKITNIMALVYKFKLGIAKQNLIFLKGSLVNSSHINYH